jgi:hypothetical protein
MTKIQNNKDSLIVLVKKEMLSHSFGFEHWNI